VERIPKCKNANGRSHHERAELLRQDAFSLLGEGWMDFRLDAFAATICEKLSLTDSVGEIFSREILQPKCDGVSEGHCG
jgi:hypothetical protein